MAAKPDGYEILVIAEKYGVLPDDVENRMTDYWMNRTLEYMEAESINVRKRDADLKKKHGHK